MLTDQFIYTLKLLRPEILTQGPTDSESDVLKEHAAYLQRLSTESVVLLAGRTQTSGEETFGLVILRADSESGARDIMENDPAVSHGVMTARLFPYSIFAISPDIDSLTQ